jgi:hypothetical protein
MVKTYAEAEVIGNRGSAGGDDAPAQKETARSRGWPGAGLVSLRISLRQAAANVRQVPARQLAIVLPLFPESLSKSMRA